MQPAGIGLVFFFNLGAPTLGLTSEWRAKMLIAWYRAISMMAFQQLCIFGIWSRQKK
jgi:hypothetical protein